MSPRTRTPSRRARRRHGPRCAALGLLVGACAAPAADESALERALREPASGPITRLTHRDNGLEVRKWLVPDDAAALARAMAAHAEADALEPEDARRLRRNGLRLVRVALPEVEPLLAAIGGASLDVNAWHGQMPRWGPLHEVAIPAPGIVLAVDGRIRRCPAGKLQLLGRSWTMPMEDGPRMLLELAPAHAAPGGPRDLRGLLGGPDRAPQRFESLAAEAMLDPGYAYALTCEAPAVDWFGGPAPDAGQGGGGAGPMAEAPRTIGQVMLSNEGPRPLRGVLLFIPRLPAS